MKSSRRFSTRVLALAIWSLVLVLWAIFGIVWSAVSFSRQYFEPTTQFGAVSIYGIVTDGIFIITAIFGWLSLLSPIPIRTRLVLAWSYLAGLSLTFLMELIRLVLYMALFPTYKNAYGANAIVVVCFFVIIGFILLSIPFMLITVSHIQHLNKVIRLRNLQQTTELQLATKQLAKSLQLTTEPLDNVNIGIC
jgi:hypothetical protein